MNLKKITHKIAPIVVFFSTASFTQASTVTSDFLVALFQQIGFIINLLVPVLIGIALLVFIWGLVVYIAKSGDESAKEEGKRKMIWGIIALFAIVAVWGIVYVVQEIILGTDHTYTTPDAADVPWD